MKGEIRLKAIKSLYNYLISFELFCTLLFFIYFVMNGYSVIMAVGVAFTEEISFYIEFEFNWTTLLIIVGAIVTIYVLIGLNVVDTGFTDEGSKSIKDIISFLVIMAVLINCMNYILYKSVILRDYISFIDIFALFIHILNFIDKGDS